MPSLRPFSCRLEPSRPGFPTATDPPSLAKAGAAAHEPAALRLRAILMTFDTLGLPEPLLRAVVDAGYAAPTDVQSAAIPNAARTNSYLA